MADLNELKPVGKLNPFAKFCCTIGNLPTSYMISLTYEEQLLWLCKYLEDTVIPAVNTNAEAVQELQELYVVLKNYVDHYFENLDVQEEINNKLDEMAKDGTLTNLIKNYVDPIQENFENEINNTIEDITSRLNSIASGSPLVASSISEMTDTTRVYVNTTNGHWYYYNGTNWEDGGIYQAVEIANESIYPENTIFKKRIGLLPNNDWLEKYTISNGVVVSNLSASCNEEYIPVQPGDILYTNKLNTNLFMHYYDVNKNYVSQQRFNNILKRTVPNDIYYIRFSINNINITKLPETYQQIYKESEFIKVNNTNLKSNNKENYTEVTGENVYINKSNIEILEAPYIDGTVTVKEKRNEATLNVTINQNRPRGIYLKNNLKKGDVLVVDLKENLNNIQQISFFNYDVTRLGSATVINNKARFEINENVYNNLSTIISILADLTATQETTYTIDYKITVEKDFYTLEDFMNYYFNNNSINKQYKGIFLGDSITALSNERSWINYFNEIIPMSSIINVSVAGAQLKDTSPNQQYDGNPVYFPNNPDNVLGNQVQKIINNNYETPDFIFIAIGTNGGIRVSSENDIFNVYYDENNNLISLQNIDRTTDAGAFRYCQETLHNLYPSAIIVWCTPIQAVQPTSGSAVSMRTVKNILLWGNNLKQFTSVASCICIDTEKCGINGVNEINGQNGEYLQDGLHPNANGAKQMGYYNACEFKKYLDKINLLSSI